MRTIRVRTCANCELLFCNAEGFEFKKIPVPQPDKRAELWKKLGLTNYKVAFYGLGGRHPACCPDPDCVKAKRQHLEGRPSWIPIESSRPRHHPSDFARGSQDNAVRTLEN